MTSVFLSEDDAIMFVNFQKHYAFIRTLEAVGAFDLKSGSITIHFDNMGAIGSIEKQQHFKPYLSTPII